MTWDAFAGWEAAKSAGMLVEVSAVTMESGETVSFWAKWQSPMRLFGEKNMSREYEIEYRYDDCPDLAEGDQVLNDVVYRVRESPYVPQVKDRGEYRRALLTRVLD